MIMVATMTDYNNKPSCKKCNDSGVLEIYMDDIAENRYDFCICPIGTSAWFEAQSDSLEKDW